MLIADSSERNEFPVPNKNLYINYDRSKKTVKVNKQTKKVKKLMNLNKQTVIKKSEWFEYKLMKMSIPAMQK